MNKLLYEICRDAIEKLRSTAEEEQRLLIDTASDVLILSKKVWREGLLSMEEAVQDWDSEFGKELAHLIVEGTDPDRLLELASNLYWIEDPQGVQAMVDYFYLRGILSVQLAEPESMIAETLRTLIPKNLQREYVEEIENVEKSAKMRHQEEISSKFVDTYPVLHNADMIENVRALEEKIESFSNRDIQRLVRDIDNHSLADCVYAVNMEMREKILNNVSKRVAYVIMEEIVSTKDRNEEVVNGSILKVAGIIDTLRERGVLHPG